MTRAKRIPESMREITRWGLALAVGAAAGCGGAQATNQGTTGGSQATQASRPQTRTMTVQSGDVRLHVRVTGDPRAGIPLVVAHGGPGLSHHYILGLEQLATPTRAVVIYDERGVGQSTTPTPNEAAQYALSYFVADVEAIRQAIGAERIHMGGHSMGGLVAMSYAAAHPEHTASLVLFNSGPPTMRGLQAALQRFGAKMQQLASEGVIPAQPPGAQGDNCRPGEDAIFPIYFANYRNPPARDLGETTCHANTQALTMAALEDYDVRQALGSWTGPTLIVGGSDEPFGDEMQADVQASFRRDNVTNVVLPSCGHLPWVECPQPLFQAVNSFLARHSG